MNSITDLKEYIKKTHLTELSKRFKVSEATARRWKNGKSKPGLEILEIFVSTDVPKINVPKIDIESTDEVEPERVKRIPRKPAPIPEGSIRSSGVNIIPVKQEQEQIVDLNNPPAGYQWVPEINDQGQPSFGLIPITGYKPTVKVEAVEQPVSKVNPFKPIEQYTGQKTVTTSDASLKIVSIEDGNITSSPEKLSTFEGRIPIDLNETELNYLRDLFFNWKGKNVCILFPCHKLTNPGTAQVLMALCLDLGKHKAHYFVEHGDAMIYNSRNFLAHKFLNETDAEWSLWIDDDIIPPIGRPDWFKKVGNLPANYPEQAAGMHFLNRLLSHKKSMVGAIYFGRQMYGPPLFGEMLNREANDAARRFVNEVRPTQWIATGCLLVHRNVYLDIQKKFPELDPHGVGEPNSGESKFQFFKPDLKIQGGEDVVFSYRAKEAGHTVFADLGCHALHVGFNAFGSHNTTNKEKNPNRI